MGDVLLFIFIILPFFFVTIPFIISIISFFLEGNKKEKEAKRVANFTEEEKRKWEEQQKEKAKKEQEKKRQAEAEKERVKKIEFINECYERCLFGASFDTPEEIENRVYDAGAKHGVSQRQSMQYYEEEFLRKYLRYAKLHGRSKRIAVLEDEIKRHEWVIARLSGDHDRMYALENAMYQKEHDWAIHGGVASGIAGPAAGVVTALNIQQKNQQIRAQNAMVSQAMTMAGAALTDRINTHKSAIKRKQETIQEIRYKPISSKTPEECYSMLDIDVEEFKVGVSSTGSIAVVGPCALKSRLENITVDGTILAEIYEGDRYVCDVYLVLPENGVNEYCEAYLHGISEIKGSPLSKSRCKVKLKPYKLWCVED